MKDQLKKDIANLTLISPFCYPLLAFGVKTISSYIAATDGINIFINEKRFNNLEESNRQFILLHEWLHVVFLDCANKTKNHKYLNFASDFRINQMIIDEVSSYLKPPKGVLYDSSLKKCNSDMIYDKLSSEIKLRKSNGYIPSCPYCGQVFTKYDVRAKDEDVKCGACYRPNSVDVPPPDFIDFEFAVNFLMEAEYDLPFNGSDGLKLSNGESTESIIDKILKSSERYLSKGLLPSSLVEHIQSLKKSEIPWERLLMKYAKESLRACGDRSPYRPDPKYIINDVVVPTEVNNKISKLVLILDTSGSMYQESFEDALGQVQRLSKFCEKLTVITIDAAIQGIFKVKNIKNELKKKKFVITGRGGTDMGPAIEKADTLKPNLILVYSDMYLDFPKKPKSDIIWLNCSREQIKPPYGRIINVINRKRNG
jgi:predicted metal-dependent peptidase